MSSSAPPAAGVIEAFDTLAPPGTPWTTSEVAAAFDCTARELHVTLDTLVETGRLHTKAIDADDHVWWRPVGATTRFEERDVADVADDPSRGEVRSLGRPDSEMARRIDEFEWSNTSLGPMDQWSRELHVSVDIMLGASEAIGIYWGEDLTLLYNDAWRELIGEKHPTALGRPARETFPEIWETIGPTLEGVLNGSGAVFEREQRLPLERDGQLRDAWFDYSFNPIPLAGGSVGGIFNIAVEVTKRERLEQNLQDEKERFDVAVTNSPLTVWQMDSDYRYTWIKHPHSEFEESVVLGKRDEDLLPQASAERVMKPKRRAVETGETVREEVTYVLQTGEEVSYDLTVAPLRDDSGEISGVTCAAFDITERKAAEAALERQAELNAFRVELSDQLRQLADPIEVQTTAARVLGEYIGADHAHHGEVYADENTCRVYSDYHTDQVPSLVGEYDMRDYGEFLLDAYVRGDSVVIEDITTAPGIRDEDRAAYQDVGVSAYLGVPLVKEGRLVAFFVAAQSVPRTWTDSEAEMVAVTAERTWAAVERAHAEVALKESYELLQRFNTATRELIGADTTTISESAAELTQHVLDVEYAALWCYNQDIGEIEACASHVADGFEARTVTLPDELPEHVWQTFIDKELRIQTGLDVPLDGPSGSSLKALVLAPVGRHGVICIGSTRQTVVDEWVGDERMADFARTVAATIESAWDRAEGERELAENNAELTNLDRLNALIRGIDQILVNAETTDAIYEAVCERLAASDLYEFAWIGEYDAHSKSVMPREWAGIDSSYFDAIQFGSDDPRRSDPITAAASTGELQVVADIATDSRSVNWRELTLKRGARSCISIPLVYDNSLYGVLTVYLGQPYQDERNRDVLAELGQTVAHAVSAVESRETRGSANVVELTLRSRKADTPFCRLSRELDCTFDIEGAVPNADGDVTVFFTATGVDSSTLLAAGEQLHSLDGLRCLVEREGGALFHVRLSAPPLISQFVASTVTMQMLSIDAGEVTAVVDILQTEDVRTVVEGFQRVVPDLEVRSRRTHTRPLRTADTYRSSVEGTLTPRQREILELSYRSGFFESPRVRTGKDLSDALDISQSTFTYHLRGAERRLCEFVFDPS
ncbi:bacterio-opsin activator domain-containing protein [Haloferax namakaokahaiae]|uniref:Bacterio-opsin activator domain-containing protein n=1 Tax=Haloferax namakaokahaiae TaxID=1748331 RepID=A0ABD5ZEG2_9EURY